MNLSRTHTRFAAVAAAGALLALPTAGQAKMRPDTKGADRCAQTRGAAFAVHGTLVSATASTVTLKVTSASRHARRSGEIADQDGARRGVQVRGAEYTVPAGDAFELKLRHYEGADTPSAGDRVRVAGRVALTRKRCAPAGTSVADRHGAVDVRRVAIADRDPGE